MIACCRGYFFYPLSLELTPLLERGLGCVWETSKPHKCIDLTNWFYLKCYPTLCIENNYYLKSRIWDNKVYILL